MEYFSKPMLTIAVAVARACGSSSFSETSALSSRGGVWRVWRSWFQVWGSLKRVSYNWRETFNKIEVLDVGNRNVHLYFSENKMNSHSPVELSKLFLYSNWLKAQPHFFFWMRWKHFSKPQSVRGMDGLPQPPATFSEEIILTECRKIQNYNFKKWIHPILIFHQFSTPGKCQCLRGLPS